MVVYWLGTALRAQFSIILLYFSIGAGSFIHHPSNLITDSLIEIQVLNFKAYFQEPVVEDATENFRIRKCILYYYLDDDTIHIIETRVENSGIPQGVFLKRHKLPKPGQFGTTTQSGGQTYDWSDLKLGANLDVYGRVFRIIDSDDFTKAFFANEGLEIGTPESFPDDPFIHTRAMINMKQNPPDLAEHKNY